jgi:hypothetical protein
MKDANDKAAKFWVSRKGAKEQRRKGLYIVAIVGRRPTIFILCVFAPWRLCVKLYFFSTVGYIIPNCSR